MKLIIDSKEEIKTEVIHFTDQKPLGNKEIRKSKKMERLET